MYNAQNSMLIQGIKFSADWWRQNHLQAIMDSIDIAGDVQAVSLPPQQSVVSQAQQMCVYAKKRQCEHSENVSSPWLSPGLSLVVSILGVPKPIVTQKIRRKCDNWALISYGGPSYLLVKRL